MPFSPKLPLIFLPGIGLHTAGQKGSCFQNKMERIVQSTPSSFQGISTPMRNGWDGNADLPVIPSARLSGHTYMKTERICLP